MWVLLKGEPTQTSKLVLSKFYASFKQVLSIFVIIFLNLSMMLKLDLKYAMCFD